ncbi:hypothetical protein CRUP_019173 [Coryphaenoides rupestris]|nr:hypothetical protein CRUP_019173 [Coryphaenoides rupestris]
MLTFLGEKRKRHNEVDVPGEESKKRQRPSVPVHNLCRGGPSETPAPSPEPEPWVQPSRLSRTQRLKHLRRGGGQCDVAQPTLQTESEAESISCGLKAESISYGLNTDAGVDDVLWTEKYSPRHSSEVIGNSGSVNKLHSWLKKWRRRVDGDDRREDVEKKRQQNDDGSWDCGDFQGEARSEGEKTVEPLSNTLLITGPPGVGKTSSVYACAQELGFKVFEVNCSSQRSGRCVLAQLKEVTQSHLVEAPGLEPLRPAYFNNYNPHSSRSRPDALPGRTGGHSKENPANPGTATLDNFFKTKAEEPVVMTPLPPGNHQERCDLTTRPAEVDRPEKKTVAMSLVLFEEVRLVYILLFY